MHNSFILYETYTWPVLEERWIKCQAYRLHFIEKNKETTQNILKKCPPYKAPLGYRLIDLDFRFLYSNSECLINKWEEFEKNILSIMQSSLSKPNEKEILDDLQAATDSSK